MRKSILLLVAMVSVALLSSCAHEPRSAAAGSSARLSCDQAADLAVQAGCNESHPATGGGGMRRGFGSAASAADIGYLR